MKKLLVLPLLIVMMGFNGDKMTKTKLSDNISCLLPQNMHPMIEGEVIRRLPSARKPIAAYTDESQLVDFSVNMAATQWAEKDIEIAQSFYKSSILNLYDDVKFIKEEIVTINKKQFIVFEFLSLVQGDDLTMKPLRKYSYVQYALYNSQALVFGFNCPAQLRTKWQETAGKIMNSVKIK